MTGLGAIYAGLSSLARAQGLGLNVDVTDLATAMYYGQANRCGGDSGYACFTPSFSQESYQPNQYPGEPAQSIDPDDYVDDGTAAAMAGMLGATVVKLPPVDSSDNVPVPAANFLQFPDGSLVNAGQIASLVSEPVYSLSQMEQIVSEAITGSIQDMSDFQNKPEPANPITPVIITPAITANPIPKPPAPTAPTPVYNAPAPTTTSTPVYNAPAPTTTSTPVYNAPVPTAPTANGSTLATNPNPTPATNPPGTQQNAPAATPTCWTPFGAQDTSACWGPITQTTAIAGIVALALLFMFTGGKR